MACASAMAVGGVGVAGCATGVLARVGRFLRCGGSCQRYGGGRRGCGTHSADHLNEKQSRRTVIGEVVCDVRNLWGLTSAMGVGAMCSAIVDRRDASGLDRSNVACNSID